MLDQNALRNKIYAGVLGKLIGVYLGRPIEGWPYERIQQEFGDVYHYVHRKVGVPLIVADDDISGTFGFFRSLKDNGFPKDITPQQIGETWRNYIIENKTILWWGGLGRSTEHTAYLNLKNGIEAPQSGSIEQNGQAVAEQIGAQIFIEGFAMCYPGDPDKTVDLVRKAASVSHDGMAVDAACHLAALDAMAFEQKNLDVLLDNAYFYLKDDRLKKLVSDVRNICAKNNYWRDSRIDLDQKYGYHLYPGTCHIAPNHAMVLASILHGGDDFQESVMIATSAGWDTDCNAGNVGAFNGIRLGLEGINAGADLRSEVADRLLVITSDGGEAVSDATREAEKIVEAACSLNDIPYTFPENRFNFSYPGALQGFSVCPEVASPGLSMRIGPAVPGNGIGLYCIGLGRGLTAAVSTPTFVEFAPNETNYLSTASPTLYETQTITCTVKIVDPGDVYGQLYIVYDDIGGHKTMRSDPVLLNQPEHTLSWMIPALGGKAILRAGLALSSPTNYSGKIRLLNMDWTNTPKYFFQTGTLMNDIWDLHPKQLQMWTSSALNFAPDMQHTYCVSHPTENGLATIGTNDWTNYTVSAILHVGLCKNAGLVLNCKGHRQYYAATFSTDEVRIIVMSQGHRTILARQKFLFKQNIPYHMSFSYHNGKLQLIIDGEKMVEAYDTQYTHGGCGFMIDCGTMLADSFRISE